MIDNQIFSLKMAELDEIVGKTLSKTAKTVYYRALSNNLTTQEFIKAIDNLICEWSYSYYPKPAQILEKAKQFNEIDLDLIAKQAAKAFEYAIESVGRNTIPEFEDKVIPVVIDMLGGWVYCCSMPSYDDLKWLKKEFERVYKQVVEKGNIKQVELLPAVETAGIKQVSCDYELPKLKELPANNLLENKGVNLALGFKRM